MDSKSCSRCKCVKSVKDFYKSKNERLGVSSQCKECHLELKRAYRNTKKGKAKLRKYALEHKEELNQAVYRWNKRNPRKASFARYRYNILCNIKKDESYLDKMIFKYEKHLNWLKKIKEEKS